MGATFDWKSEVVTCQPDYYRWNQWIFLKFLEAGLAYRKMAAGRLVPQGPGGAGPRAGRGVDRVCWRCGTQVIKRDLEQWFFRITDMPTSCSTSRASTGPSRSRLMQTNWIGRSEGADVIFRTAPSDAPRGRRGAARLHHATGHALRRHLHGAGAGASAGRRADRAGAARGGRGLRRQRRAARPRSSASPPTARRPACPLGADAINPVNGERIPIWIADYVLASYGTGAIMAVPGPRRARLRLRPAVRPPHPARRGRPEDADDAPLDEAYVAKDEHARLVNSGPYSGRPWAEGFAAIVADLEASGTGRSHRHLPHPRLAGQPPARLGHAHPGGLLQRPTAASCRCPRTELPVLLPEDFRLSPKAVATRSRRPSRSCARPARSAAAAARRETDTMDTFVDSSWYYWRYLSPQNADGRHRPDTRERWCPSTSTPAAPSTPSCTCSTAASSPRR